MRNVVVTGASSMLGAALIQELIKSDSVKKIYAVVREQESGKKNVRVNRIPFDEKISILEVDFLSYDKLVSLISEKCDVFYHFAWPRTLTYDENVSDIINKCDAVKSVVMAANTAKDLGCTKFIGAGSQAEYGIPANGYYKTDMDCHPLRVDGITHYMAYELIRKLCDDIGIKYIWARIFSLYGIKDRNNSMIMNTIDKLMKGEHCSFTKAEQTWDYLNVDDAARAFRLLGEKVEKSSVYNIASGISKPLREYIETIRDVVDEDAELGFGEIDYPQNPIMKMEVDISELVRDIGWKPNISFEDGIREIYDRRYTDII